MASSYSPDLRIQLMANGENSGTWGTVTNTNLGTILEDAISGVANVDIVSTSQALTALNGLADQARCSTIVLTSSLTSALTLYIPAVTKLYVIVNNTGQSVTIATSNPLGSTTSAGGLTLAIPASSSCLIRCDGLNVYEQLNRIVGNLTVDGILSTTGSPTFNGNLVVDNSAFLGGAQTATFSIGTPTIITVGSSPVSNAVVSFSVASGGTLPVGITAGELYYVSKINATTFNISSSPTLSPLINVGVLGTGVITVNTASLVPTPSSSANDTQIASTAYVKGLLSAIPVSLTNWSLSETNTENTATMTISTPVATVVTLPSGTSPANGTAVAFTTTGALPTGVTAGTPYYVFNRTSSTYNLATTLGQSQTATYVSANPSVFFVAAPPNNGAVVYFTGTTPSGVTAGTNYYVVNRSATYFQVSATSGGAAITFTASGSCTATWQYLVVTSGTQSGVHTENTSKLYFKYKTVDKMSIDLGGNTIASGNVTAFGTP